MSYGGQTLALDVKPFSIDAGAIIQDANKIQQSGVDLQKAQTDLAILNRQDQAGDIEFRSGLIRNAIMRGQMDSDSWDAAMNDAAARGAPEAKQYVGRYTPILAERLLQSYGAEPSKPGRGEVQGLGQGGLVSDLAAAGGTAGGGGGVKGTPTTPNELLDREFQNVPPEKMAASLQKLDMVNSALMGVKDQASLQAAVQQLIQAGIPEARQFLGLQYNPWVIRDLYNRIAPLRAYLQQRLMGTAIGEPEPLIPNEIKEAGGGLYSVDPYQHTAKELVPPTQRAQFAGTTPEGAPISLDTRDNKFYSGGKEYTGKIEAKPSVATNNWKFKHDAALAAGHTEDEAISIANGQKMMTPQEARKAAIQMAQKDASDAALANTPIPNDQLGPWMQKRTDKYFQDIMGAQAPVKPAAPAPANRPPATAEPGSIKGEGLGGKTVYLPPRAVAHLQEGKPFTFHKMGTWTLKNGKPVQVQPAAGQ